MKVISLLSMLILFAGASVAAAPQEFDNPEKQARYDNMLREMRCMVCQNESLAGSPAELAQDLRREVARMIREEKSDAEIRSFLVERYGDYVLYRPPLRAQTLALWVGPFVILLLALAGVAVYLWRRRPGQDEAALDPDEQARLKRLLGEGEAS